MVKVFILGASGYIGLPVARKFASKGYTVYGLVRSNEKAKQLIQEEIIPVIGKAQDTATWIKYAQESDIIIDLVADHQDPSASATIQKELIPLAQNKSKTVIYTSGIWVYGSSKEVVTETTPLNPPRIVQWRPAAEKNYTDAGAIVLRPGCVYGKQGSLTGIWMKGVHDKKVVIPGDGNNYWSFVHVDDLADGYVKVAENPSAKGQAFNFTSSYEKVGDCVKALIESQGLKLDITYVPAADPFSEALALDAKIDNGKVRFQLGWNPTHTTFVNGAAHYYKTWESYQ